jgi:hypothetical protein
VGVRFIIKIRSFKEEYNSILRIRLATSKNTDFFFVKNLPFCRYLDSIPKDVLKNVSPGMSLIKGKNLFLLKFKTKTLLNLYLNLSLFIKKPVKFKIYFLVKLKRTNFRESSKK